MKKGHWTERSIKDYRLRIVIDFLAQLEKKIESRKQLAKKLGLSKGRISQIFNKPSNFTLDTIVKYSRALGMKVSIVAYEDDDPKNERGPINSEIFQICWEQSGKPQDFWAIANATAANMPMFRRADDVKKVFDDYKVMEEMAAGVTDHLWEIKDIISLLDNA